MGIEDMDIVSGRVICIHMNELMNHDSMSRRVVEKTDNTWQIGRVGNHINPKVVNIVHGSSLQSTVRPNQEWSRWAPELVRPRCTHRRNCSGPAYRRWLSPTANDWTYLVLYIGLKRLKIECWFKIMQIDALDCRKQYYVVMDQSSLVCTA
jgi:hypothetical protein